MSHQYKLTYDIDPKLGPFTVEEVKASGRGGTDAFVFISCISPDDGSYSQTFFSFDGRNEGKELSSVELFKAWMLMGKALSERQDMGEIRQYIAAMPMDAFKAATRG